MKHKDESIHISNMKAEPPCEERIEIAAQHHEIFLRLFNLVQFNKVFVGALRSRIVCLAAFSAMLGL